MDVETVGEGLAQRRRVRHMRENAKLDLAVIGGDQLLALLRDEGLADGAALRSCAPGCSANSARAMRAARWSWRQARRRCARARSPDGCRWAARRYRCSSAWRAAASREPCAAARGPRAASSSSAAASVLQAPVLVRLPPGRLILSNRISPSCFGEPILKSSPASALISSSSRARRLREIAGERRRAWRARP